MPKQHEFLQISEAVEFLGVCTNTLRNWGRDGKIKEYRHRMNNYRLYKLSELRKVQKQLLEPMPAKAS